MAKGVIQAMRQATAGDRRENLRKKVGANSSVRLTEIMAEFIVEVKDISASGCRITSKRPILLGTEVVVGLGGAGSVEGKVVNKQDLGYGIEFARVLTPAELATAFSGTQIITLFATHEVTRDEVEGEFSIRTKAAIIAALTILSWYGVFGALRLGGIL